MTLRHVRSVQETGGTTMTTTKQTYGAVIDHLTYCCYRYNRQISPEVSPERWGLLFSNWEAMEARYQSEQSSK
jgi:hypothetical protein